MARTLVAGVDSSTQSCKVVIRDAETGELVRSGRAAHPDGTEVPPSAWAAALRTAIAQAGGLDDVAALSVGAQQHGMVCLDEDGEVVRDALLWNDTRSAAAAEALLAEAGPGPAGRETWARAVGSVPLASFTVTKLRWLAEHEPAAAERTAAVALPHDWLTWRLAGAPGLDALRTDRSDASGTGYWSPADGEYRRDLLRQALGKDVLLPEVLGPRAEAGRIAADWSANGRGSAGRSSDSRGSDGRSGGWSADGVRLGPGAGDNAAAALGAGAGPGDVIVSIGTSGTVFAVADKATADGTGAVAGFADATGRYLPLVCTLNAGRVLDATGRMLGVDLAELSRLALSAPAGSDGLVLVPYLEGERTPDRPDATGSLHGLTLRTATSAHLARAAVEGMLCALADGLDALLAQGVRCERILLVGGGARSAAVQQIAPSVFGRPVVIPPPGEYVADGAARQAAWLLTDSPEPPPWTIGTPTTAEAPPTPALRTRYAAARDQVLPRL